MENFRLTDIRTKNLSLQDVAGSLVREQIANLQRSLSECGEKLDRHHGTRSDRHGTLICSTVGPSCEALAVVYSMTTAALLLIVRELR